MTRHHRIHLVAALSLSAGLHGRPTALRSQQSPGAPRTGWAGTWKGTLVVETNSVQLALTVRPDSVGGWVGLMKSVASGAQAPAVIRVSRDTLRFAVAAEHISYVGVASAPGDSLRGTFTQGPSSFPLAFGYSVSVPEVGKPQDPKPPFPYRATDVSIASVPGVRLAGTLIIPDGAGPFPAVVFVTGSGAQDRDEALLGHRPFLVIADYLARHGIASLRYDDRGYAKSSGTFESATTADFANDAEAAVHYLQGVAGIARDRVGIIGHSEGGVVGPMVAARTRDVAFLVLLAGTGVPGDSVSLLQLRRIQGQSESQVALFRQLFRAVAETKDSADAVARLAAAKQQILSQLPVPQRSAVGARIDQTAAALLAPWMRYFLRYDPRVALRAVHAPVLALDGSLDIQVSARENLSAIAGALKEAGNNDVRTVELPGLNHLLQPATTGAVTEYAKIDETISPQVLDLIATWISGRFGHR